MSLFGVGGGYQQSSSNTQSSSDQNTNQNATGSYTNGPINANQLGEGLAFSRSALTGGNGNVNTGLAQVQGGANTGLAAYGAASPELAKTLSGGYLSAGNPAFQQMAARVGAATRSTIDSGFEGAGRYGSPLAARAQGMGVGDAIGALGYQNYAAERANQMGALGVVPGFAAGATAPGAASLAAGMTPLQAYIASLGSLNLGQTGTTTGDLTKRIVQNTTGSTDTSGFDINANVGGGSALSK